MYQCRLCIDHHSAKCMLGYTSDDINMAKNLLATFFAVIILKEVTILDYPLAFMIIFWSKCSGINKINPNKISIKRVVLS